MRGHIRKKNKSYQVIIYLGKDVNGKKQYKYYTAKDKKGAEKMLTKLLYQLDTNTFADPGKITFGEYLEQWLENYCVPRLAPKTFVRYQEIVQLHIIPSLGNIQLIKLQPMHIQLYYTKALTEGRIGAKYREKKGLSPTTVLFHHRVINKALNQAIKWQLIVRNPAEAVEPPRKERTEFGILNAEELAKIFKHIKERYPIAYLPIILAGCTGMRRGEVLGVRWTDLSDRRLSISKQLQRIDGKLVMCDTKNDSRRNITLPDFVVDMLKKYKIKQNMWRLGRGERFIDKEGLIFTWEDGRPIDPDYLTKIFINKTAKKLGFHNIRLHDLRHSFATMLLSKKVPIKVVSEILGHSSTAITSDIYSHVTPSMKEEVAEVVEGELAKGIDSPRKHRLPMECP